VKTKLLNFCINSVKKKYPNYNKDNLEIIEYGLESLYLTISKVIVIITLSLILGIFKKVILILIFYNIIRFTSFGLHAKKSWHCLLISTTMFIGGVYLCEYTVLSLFSKCILSIICICLIARFAPADTEKRPLINRKKRLKYKVISIITSGIFSILIVVFDQHIISNYLLFGMIFATFMILPISYKIFNLPYDNYKRYKLNEV